MYENDGSNALKREYVYEVPMAPKKRAVTVRKPQKRSLTGEKKAAIFVSLLAVSALAFVVLMLMATLNTEYRTLSQKKAVLSGVEAQVEQLSSETEGAVNAAVTEEQAAELGLYKINSDQVVYISLDNADSGEILAEDKSGSGIRAFFNKVAAIAEYFY